MKLTPSNVLEARDTALRRFFGRIPDDIIDYGVQRQTAIAPKTVRELEILVRSAEIVIWDRPIFDLAISGNEVFQSPEVMWPEVSPRTQLWCLADAEWGFEDTDRQCDFLLVILGQKEIWAGGLYYDHEESQLIVRVLKEGFQNPSNCGTAAFLAASIFLETKIAACQTHAIDKRVAKHWEKRNYRILPTINTVVLRGAIGDEYASQSAQPGGVPRNWTHRWAVRPHWAIRHCGKERSSKKVVFIEGYIKGPKHLPFIHKDIVYRAIR